MKNLPFVTFYIKKEDVKYFKNNQKIFLRKNGTYEIVVFYSCEFDLIELGMKMQKNNIYFNISLGKDSCE